MICSNFDALFALHQLGYRARQITREGRAPFAFLAAESSLFTRVLQSFAFQTLFWLLLASL